MSRSISQRRIKMNGMQECNLTTVTVGASVSMPPSLLEPVGHALLDTIDLVEASTLNAAPAG